MARPKTKSELLQASQNKFAELNDFVDSFSIEEQHVEFPTGTLNRNIRDVLAHLHHWHTMMLKWYEMGMKGIKPDMPAKGYTWKTTPKLNFAIWEMYQHTQLEKVRKELSKSYQLIQKVIEYHSEIELFEKKKYKWTGSTSLGSYLVSTSSSHYDWAIKLIKKAKKV